MQHAVGTRSTEQAARVVSTATQHLQQTGIWELQQPGRWPTPAAAFAACNAKELLGDAVLEVWSRQAVAVASVVVCKTFCLPLSIVYWVYLMHGMVLKPQLCHTGQSAYNLYLAGHLLQVNSTAGAPAVPHTSQTVILRLIGSLYVGDNCKDAFDVLKSDSSSCS
jgi:hypothetical protein